MAVRLVSGPDSVSHVDARHPAQCLAQLPTMQTVLSSSLIQGGIPLLLLSLASAEALPTGLSEPAYVPNPTGRGTVGLLTSCALTLFLCVWTAIHINVFPK